MGFEAVELFSQIPLKMLNERTFICVLNACAHSGLVDQAKQIFENIPNKTEFIFTTMVSKSFSLEIFSIYLFRSIVLVEHFFGMKLKKQLINMNFIILHHYRCIVSSLMYFVYVEI
jgi:pentatricopeptide repeat protein